MSPKSLKRGDPSSFKVKVFIASKMRKNNIIQLHSLAIYLQICARFHNDKHLTLVL